MTDWKALQKGVRFVLPESGLEVFLRPVDFTIFAAYADLTDEMSGIIQSAIKELTGQVSLEVPNISIGENLVQSRRVMEGYAKCAFASPRAVDNPTQENEINPAWLGWKDLGFVYGLFNLSLPELIRFSEEQAQSLQSVSDEPVHAH